MTSNRTKAGERQSEARLEKAIRALVERAQSVVGALASQPQLQPIPVRVRTRRQSRHD